MTYLLAGIVISSVGDAFIMLLKYMADPLGELAAIEFWTMGSLASMTLEKMMMSLIGVMIPMLLILLCHRQITMLSLGDENATYLGLNTKTFKIFIFILTTWMVASVVALTGVISFVGLIAPHIAYLLLHKRTGAFFICSGFIGAILILVGDLLARCLIPVSYTHLDVYKRQQLYNTVDTIIVGQYVGTSALAAVGSTGNLTNLIVNFFVGLSSGATVVIAQFYGANEKKRVSKAVHTSIAMSLVCGIFMTLFGLVFAYQCLQMIGVPNDIIDASSLYMRLYFLRCV